MILGLLLAVHLLCVNVAAGGPVLGAWLDWRALRGDEAAGQAAKYLARAAFIALLVGAVLGLAMGGLKWDAAYRELWMTRLSYKLHWAVLDVLFSLLLMGVWWFWLPGKTGVSRSGTVARIAVAILAATNLLYHFPPLFSIAAELSASGQIGGERIGAGTFRSLMTASPIPSLWIHVVFASLAAAGVALLGLALRLQRAGELHRASRVAAWGGRWALVASLAQLPTGLWTLASLPPHTQGQLMGQDAIATLLFVAAMLAAFWLMQELFQAAFGTMARPVLIRAMGALLVTVSLMTLMHTRARQSAGGPPRASEIEILPRNGP